MEAARAEREEAVSILELRLKSVRTDAKAMFERLSAELRELDRAKQRAEAQLDSQKITAVRSED